MAAELRKEQQPVLGAAPVVRYSRAGQPRRIAALQNNSSLHVARSSLGWGCRLLLGYISGWTHKFRKTREFIYFEPNGIEMKKCYVSDGKKKKVQM